MAQAIGEDRKYFYKQILTLAIPVAMQNLISFGVNMTDTVMMGLADHTGVLLSAASLANQPFFLLSLICFGLAGATVTLTAQYWGKGETAPIRCIFSMILKAAATAAIAMGLAVMLFPEGVMSIFTNRSEVIEAGAQYLQIVGLAYIAFGIGNTLICCLRGVELIRLSTVANLCGFFTNLILNYLLIFGHMGFPEMGIRGAAVGTLCSRVLELTIVLVYVFAIDRRLELRPKDLKLFNKTLAKDILSYGAPVFFNEICWGLGISVQAAILGHVSYSQGDPVAANSIASMIQQLSTTFIFGIANAEAVLVGKAIGSGQHEKARLRAKRIKWLSIIFGLIACAIILLLKNVIVDFYDIPEATKALTRQLIVIIAFVTIFTSSSAICFIGILRGAGDTRFCLGAELAALWCVATPLAAISVFLFALPVPVVLMAMKIDEPLKMIASMVRLHGDKWLRSLTRENIELQTT